MMISAKPIKQLTQEEQDDWLKAKKALLMKDLIMNHSAGEYKDQHRKEKAANRKLDKLREVMFNEDPMIVNAPFYSRIKQIESSDLYEAFYKMPKTVVHHAHLTGCVDVDYLVKLTYYNFVYYNEKLNRFKVTKNRLDDPDYMKVNTLRQYSADAKAFDNQIRENILLKVPAVEDAN